MIGKEERLKNNDKTVAQQLNRQLKKADKHFAKRGNAFRAGANCNTKHPTGNSRNYVPLLLPLFAL